MHDYDIDEESEKLKRLLKAGVFFLVFFCFTVSDMNYLFRAETSEAQVQNV